MPGSRVIRWQFVAEPFYRPPLHLNPGSPLIEWFGAGKCSHVDTILSDDSPVRLGPPGWLYGARADRVGGRHSGVWSRPPDYAVFTYRCVATIPVTDEQADLFWRAEVEKFGMPYDTTAIWGFAAGRNWRDTDSWFCSEKQIDSALRAGIVRPLPGPISKVPPPAAMSIISQVAGVTFEV